MDPQELGEWISETGGDPAVIEWGEEKLQALELLDDIRFQLGMARIMELASETSMRLEALDQEEDPGGRFRTQLLELLAKLKIVEAEWRKNHEAAGAQRRALEAESRR